MVALLVDNLKPIILLLLISALVGFSHLGDHNVTRQARTSPTQR